MKTLIKQSCLQCLWALQTAWEFIILLQCQSRRSVETLASAHPPTDGAQRGPGTHSAIPLDNTEAPVNTARLFAETPFQCCACTCKRSSAADVGHPHGNLTENLINPIHFCNALGHYATSSLLMPPNVGALCYRNRIFKDASGTSRRHCVAPRGDAVMIPECTRRVSWGSQAS